MSVHIFAKITVKEDRVEAVRAAMRALVTASQQEEGCLAYEAFVSQSDPTVIRVKEEYADMAAIQAHMAAPHFQKLVQDHADDFAAPLEADVLESL